MNYKGAVETVSSKGPRAILVFSKAADYGNVKTRLRPAIGDEACLQLHLAMLQDTLNSCAAAGARVLLYLAGSAGLPFAVSAPVKLQAEGSLGHRMQRAFEETLPSFYKVIIVGTDAPGLTTALLEEAFAALDRASLVLGPAEDGGYYLIGLKHTIPGLFEEVPWSTSEVLQFTLQKMPEGATHLLPRLFDVDQPADLLRLEQQIHAMPQAMHTRDWIAARKGR